MRGWRSSAGSGQLMSMLSNATSDGLANYMRALLAPVHRPVFFVLPYVTKWRRQDTDRISSADRGALMSKTKQKAKGRSRANKLSPEQRAELLRALKARFEKNMSRHRGLEWAAVQAKLDAAGEKLHSLNEMERTGGEPDVVGQDQKTGEYIFCDCSAESPQGRRSVCYDRAALESRKEHKPENSATDMAAAMGVELLTEEQYRELQKLGEFDTKTSSWVRTPSDIRKLGGAVFCDRRYGHVFLYHNGADSYYGARGFRGSLRV